MVPKQLRLFPKASPETGREETQLEGGIVALFYLLLLTMELKFLFVIFLRAGMVGLGMTCNGNIYFATFAYVCSICIVYSSPAAAITVIAVKWNLQVHMCSYRKNTLVDKVQ